MKRIVIFLLVCLNALALMAQGNTTGKEATSKPSGYEKTWEKIEQLLRSGSYNKAFDEAQGVYSRAVAHGDSREILRATYYLNYASSKYQDSDSLNERLERILPLLAPADKAMCHTLLADFYSRYSQRNRYVISRNKETDEPDLEYPLWPLSRFDSVVAFHVHAALGYADVLKQAVVSEFSFMAQSSGDAFEVTPTAYDLVAQFVFDRALLPARERQALLHDIQRFHAMDGDCVRLYWDFQECSARMYDGEDGNGLNPDSLDLAFEKYCLTLLNRYRGTSCDYITIVYLELAENFKSKARLEESKRYCDTAIALFPESRGAKECDCLRQSIVLPRIDMVMYKDQMPDKPLMAVATYANVDTIFFRIINYFDCSESWDKVMPRLLSKKVLKEWAQPVPRDGYRSQSVYAYLPPMPAGRYYLLVSPSSDFKESGFMWHHFDCTDLQMLENNNRGDSLISGYLLSRTTGKPIANHQVRLVELDRTANAKRMSVYTNSNGMYQFPNYSHNYNLLVDYEGREFKEYGWDYYYEQENEPHARIFSDRPIYRPGDTVQFSLLVFRMPHVEEGLMVDCKLRDVNDRVVDSLVLRMDEFGTNHGRFVLPPNSLPGRYTLVCSSVDKKIYIYLGDMSFVVENYRQPKFAVTYSLSDHTYRLGDTVRVEGLAASYTAMPVSMAQVAWTVRNEDDEIASGTLQTDAEGAFAFSFPTKARKYYQQARGDAYQEGYSLSVAVTDMNGETQTRSVYVTIGSRSGRLSIDVSDSPRTRTLRSFDVEYYSYNGEPVDGDLSVSVDCLAQPAVPKFANPLSFMQASHTLDSAEFARLFPNMAMDSRYRDPSCWQSRPIFHSEAHAADGVAHIALPRLGEGFYRISVSAIDRYGDTLRESRIVRFCPEDAQKVPGMDLLFADIDRTSAEVGDTARLRLGSPYPEVEAYYQVFIGAKMYREGIVSISQKFSSIVIPITPEMKGGFSVRAFALKENHYAQECFVVKVPYSEKKMELALTTFRDYLEPGQHERWSLHLSAPDGPAKGNVLLSLYDAALDNVARPLYYHFFPWESNSIVNCFSRNLDRSYSEGSLVLPRCTTSALPMPKVWRLGGYWATVQNGFAKGTHVLKESRMANNTTVDEIVAEVGGVGSARGEDGMVGIGAPKRAADLEEEVFAVMEEAVVTEEAVAYDPSPDEASGPKSDPMPFQIRQNLSTLAFFYPSLRTDANGDVDFEFTIPDALTRWNLVGCAWTPDLKTGELRAQTVTRKSLMAVPNVPRFFRQGDTLDFLVKVSSLSDSIQPVTVALKLSDAATHRQFFSEAKPVQVPAHGSVPVSFRLVVPDDVYVATYLVEARGSHGGDGEQGLVPVLTNRQLVTESLAMYINGAGEKHYTFAHLASIDSLRAAGLSNAETVSLTVEATANPIWYAIQSMPYLAESPNPTNIYRANRLYVDALASALVQNNPRIQEIFHQWELEGDSSAFQSPLERNEEITQTLVEETPWLREAQRESRRTQIIAQYFDAEQLSRNLETVRKELLKDQHANGGWGWMPESRWTDPYITRCILKRNAQLALNVARIAHDGASAQGSAALLAQNSSVRQALHYVDGEVYKNYRKWEKKHPDCQTSDIDYLYTRSYYPDIPFSGKTEEAYRYYYANALKNCDRDLPLCTQAQLALIFHRAGDRDAALRMADRLKGKALYSDEMGMYWRDNVSGYHWYDRPIEVQALLIQVFSEVLADTQSVALMQQWLLKQKQTTRWNSDIATVDAIAALLANSTPLFAGEDDLTLAIGDQHVQSPRQAGTGYFRRQWVSPKYQMDSLGEASEQRAQALPHASSFSISKRSPGIAWGAVYWQYLEDMDKVQSSKSSRGGSNPRMGVVITKQLYRENLDGSLSLCTPTTLKVGDKVRVRILIDCDRDLEYLQLKDGRPACLEPTTAHSGWQWNSGLSYYVAVGNAANTFYIDRLSKGKYVLEYTLWVANSGNFTLPPALIQCLYSPEFRANSQGSRLVVE